MTSRRLVVAMVAAISFIGSGVSFGQTTCRQVSGGFAHTVFEIGAGTAEDSSSPARAFPPTSMDELRRSLQRLQEPATRPTVAKKPLPRLVYRLRVADQQCQLIPVGRHAKALLHCRNDQSQVDLTGLLYLENANDWPKLEEYFRSLRGGAPNDIYTLLGNPYDNIETPDGPVQFGVGELRGLALFQMASRNGFRTHDVISIAARGGCVILYMRLEASASNPAAVRALVDKATAALVVDVLTEEENRRAEARDVEEFKRREAEEAAARLPPEPYQSPLDPIGPTRLPGVKSTLPTFTRREFARP